MIPAYLQGFLTTAQDQTAFEAAYTLRAQATQRYRQRRAAVDALEAQVQAGLWVSTDVKATIRAARRDYGLLFYQAADLIGASEGRHDLAIDYRFLTRARLAPGTEAYELGLGLLEEAAPDKPTTPPWTAALRLEAETFLYRLWGDDYLRQALEALESVVARVRPTAVGRDPFDPVAVQAQIACILLYHQVGLPIQVEAAFEAFRAAYAAYGDPDFPWGKRIKTDHLFRRETRDWFGWMMAALLMVKELRNPEDRSEIDRLASRLQVAKAPLPLAPALPPFERPKLLLGKLAQAETALGQIVEALTEPGQRPVAVLRTWQALARSHLYRFHELAEGLGGVALDDEALGIVAHTLLGEAQYRLADYEDAHQNLEEAGTLADAVLQRAPAPAPDWLPGARRFLGRVAQLDGNALFFTGDDTLAETAYKRAQSFSSDDPLLAAIYGVNLGNLAYLRNNQVDQRGYVTMDWSERNQLAEEGPGALQALKIARNAAGLMEAERCYRAALDHLVALGEPDQQRDLAAAIHINLGNTAWAWAQVMGAEKVEQVGDLPLPRDWASSLVARDNTQTDCYRTAIREQQQALALASTDRALAATAWSNLAELYYLVGELDQERACLEEGLRAADQAAALIGSPSRGEDAGMLAHRGITLPEGAWRTAHNRARLFQALGDDRAAQRQFQKAIRALRAMRAQIRLDSWQATSLQDKLEVYEDYFHFLYHRRPWGYRAHLFRLLEETKAQGFLYLLENARLTIGIDPELAARRDALLARIAACNQQIREKVATAGPDDPAAKAEVVALVEAQKRDLDRWRDVQSEILTRQQAHNDLNPRRVSLAEFRRFLREREAVALSFFLGRRHSYLMVIDEQQAHTYELPPRREIELAVTRLLWYFQDTSAQTFDAFLEANNEVVRLLLGQVDQELGLVRFLAGRKVVIIPDGVLYYLPFEALLLNPVRPAGVSGLKAYAAVRPYYWLSQGETSFSYVPSASAWAHLAGRRVPPTITSILGVYDINYSMGTVTPPRWAMDIIKSLRNLASTEAVGQILAAWPSAVALRAWNVEEEPEAPEFQSTEDNFARLVAECSPQAILFAGHAIYNDKYPSLSGLIFNLAPVSVGVEVAPGSVGKQDGFLRLEEIFGLKMPHTELVFLAACQTGLGWVYRGEGLAALTRAFMYEGCPAVIASLWAVHDQTTVSLIQQFFESLLDDPAADRAQLLAQTKRRVMAKGSNSQPVYWAPFILTGVRTPQKE